MLERLERGTAAASRWLCIGGAVAAAVLMALLTAVDVVLRKLGTGVPGAFELVTLGIRIMVPLALPYTFWVGGHVAVEILTDRLPRRAQSVPLILVYGLSAAVMGYLARTSWTQLLTAWSYGDETVTIGIPHLAFWVPLVAGAALCVPVLLLMIWREATLLAGGPPPAPRQHSFGGERPE